MTTASAIPARELLESSKLQPAIEELTKGLKSDPEDIRQHTFLFELLCFAGDWERAETELNLIAKKNSGSQIWVKAYLNNIKAERARKSLFTGGVRPHFLFEPPVYIDLHLAAIDRLREGKSAEACALLDHADKERPDIKGTLDVHPFGDFVDYNELIAPVLELFLQGNYYWLPFEQVKRVRIDRPGKLGDQLWARAHIETIKGPVGEAFIPVLYAGSDEHPNDLVKLGRLTDWKKVGESLYEPIGLRLFLVDYDDISIFEISSIFFEPVVNDVIEYPPRPRAYEGHAD
jgi:type VI secretion system protein ImpE